MRGGCSGSTHIRDGRSLGFATEVLYVPLHGCCGCCGCCECCPDGCRSRGCCVAAVSVAAAVAATVDAAWWMLDPELLTQPAPSRAGGLAPPRQRAWQRHRRTFDGGGPAAQPLAECRGPQACDTLQLPIAGGRVWPSLVMHEASAGTSWRPGAWPVRHALVAAAEEGGEGAEGEVRSGTVRPREAKSI